MPSPNTLNVQDQYYQGICLTLVWRVAYLHKKAKQYYINHTKQTLWIPNKHLLADGTIRAGENLDYVFLRKWKECAIAGVDLGILTGFPGWNFTKYASLNAASERTCAQANTRSIDKRIHATFNIDDLKIAAIALNFYEHFANNVCQCSGLDVATKSVFSAQLPIISRARKEMSHYNDLSDDVKVCEMPRAVILRLCENILDDVNHLVKVDSKATIDEFADDRWRDAEDPDKQYAPYDYRLDV